MKIVYCLVDSSLSGGMERVICNKANYLSDNLGYDVTIITTDRGEKENFYQFSDKINFIDLGINYKELEAYSFTKRITEQIKKRNLHRQKLSDALFRLKPDISISTYTHELTILCKVKDGSKKIAEAHFTKQNVKLEQKNKGPLWKRVFTKITNDIRKPLYLKKYDAFVILTKEDRKNWGNVPDAKIRQIYNMLPFYPCEIANPAQKRIISVGRLTYQKGFDLLIEAWKLIHFKYPDWKIDIFGEGEDLAYLKNLTKQYGLDTSLFFNLPTKDIINEYLNSSIYIMSSRYEGFGMVLTEAMACGLPCVSFNCPQGPSEIIKDNEDGFLVSPQNVEELAEKLEILITRFSLREEMGIKAKNNITRFSKEKIMAQWKNLFDELVNK
jgi:glycosyltransferase involved in cell wall biosynthesis